MALQLRTYEDIYKAVAEELKVQLSDTTTIDRIKRDINIVYLNEVLPFDDWYWARKETKRINKKVINTGTVTVTEESKTVTLSAAPSVSYTGCSFMTEDYAEIYRVQSHSSGDTTIILDSPFQGASSAGKNYKIFEESIVLPVDCDEVYRCYHHHYSAPMDAVTQKQYVDLILNSPRREGRPRWYTVGEYDDAITFDTISGLPALSTRASDENVRTLVFASDVSSYLSEGDKVLIVNSGDNKYDGEVVIDIVSTDTIKYVHPEKLEESATADLDLELRLADQKIDNEAYRTLKIYPMIDTINTTVHVEYIEKVSPLEDVDDEPIIPLRDRVVLLYGALERAWRRIRNLEESQVNGSKFLTKLSKMAGNVQTGMDLPSIKPDNIYLTAKRKKKRRLWREF